MTDNGSGYRSRPAQVCAALSLKLKHTRAYRPCTNGKVERLIQSLLREWAYAVPFPSSRGRIR